MRKSINRIVNYSLTAWDGWINGFFPPLVDY